MSAQAETIESLVSVGDVIEISHRDWPEGSVCRGPVYKRNGVVFLAGWSLRYAVLPVWSLKVIEKAKVPFYVNSDRDPVPGDVVSYPSRMCPAETVGPFLHTGRPTWAGSLTGGRETPWVGLPELTPDTGPLHAAGKVTLLLDGTTGKPVTS